MLMLTTSTGAKGLQEAMTIRPTAAPMRDNHPGQDQRPARSRRLRFGLAIAAVK